jgi:hypothetical protein
MRTLKLVVSVAALVGLYVALRRWSTPLPSRTVVIGHVTATLGKGELEGEQAIRLLEVGPWNASTASWDEAPGVVLELTDKKTREVRRRGPYQTEAAARMAIEGFKLPEVDWDKVAP